MRLPIQIHDLDLRRYVRDDLGLDRSSLSSSMAVTLLERSPAHLFHAMQNREEEFSRQANFGSAVHAVVFGGQQLEHVSADGYTTKAAREARDAALADGKIPLLTEEMDRAFECGGAVRDAVKGLAGSGWVYESTFVWSEGNAVLRSRPDAITQDGRIILDLKVTGTNARNANAQFFSQGYDMQAMFMERAADAVDPGGIGKRQVFYLFVESEPPYGFAYVEVTEGTRMIARKKFNAAVNLWTQCQETRQWPNYPTSKIPSSRPSWDETLWLIREETDPTINVEEPK